GYIALLAGFLAGRQHHHHLAAFELGHGLDQDQFAQIVAHSFEYAHTEFLVSHLAAAKTQRDLCLVAILDETAQIAQFHLVVAFVGTWPELDFLDLDDLLAGTGFLLALLFLVLELAVVHQAADGGGGRGGDFDQIDVVLLGHGHGFGCANNAQLFAIHADQADFMNADFTVDAVFLFGCDVENSCELMKRGESGLRRFGPLLTSRDFVLQPGGEIRHRHRAQIQIAAPAHRYGAGFAFFLADDQNIRDFLQAMIADFTGDLFAP